LCPIDFREASFEMVKKSNYFNSISLLNDYFFERAIMITYKFGFSVPKSLLNRGPFLIMFLVLFFARPYGGTAQTVYLVNTLMDAPSSQLAIPDGLLTLREAVIAASTNQRFGDAPRGSQSSTDVIKIVVNGTIYLQGGELTCTGPLELAGPGANLLTIDGKNKSRVLSCLRDSSLPGNHFQAVSGLRIINGASSASGGGIFSNQYLSISEVEISLCSARKGGAVACVSSDPIDSLHVYRSTFAENTATEIGGGIYIAEQVELWLFNSTVAKCVSGLGGGGIAIDNASQSLCMHSLGSTTIADNQCALMATEAGMEFGGGIGIYTPDSFVFYSANSVIANNRNFLLGSAADVEAAIDFRGHANFIGAARDNFPMQNGQNLNRVGTAQIPLVPGLELLNLNGGRTRCMRPLASSPLVNAGRSDLVAQFATDKRGGARIRGGTVDIGSVER
jgi:hypothetical protein